MGLPSIKSTIRKIGKSVKDIVTQPGKVLQDWDQGITNAVKGVVNEIPFFGRHFGDGTDPFTRSEAEYAKEVDSRNFEREAEWREEDRNREAEWRSEDYLRHDQFRQEDIEREERWRNEDIERQERWRADDVMRNSLQYRMDEAKKAGLHTATVGIGGSVGGASAPSMGRPTSTSSGGRMPTPSRSGGSGYQGMRSGMPGMSPFELLSMSSQISMDKANQLLMHEEARKIKAETDAINLQNLYAHNREESQIALTRALKESSDVSDRQAEAMTMTILYDLERSGLLNVRTGQLTLQGMTAERMHKEVETALNNASVPTSARGRVHHAIQEMARQWEYRHMTDFRSRPSSKTVRSR